MKKVAVNCACFKKAVSYTGGRVTISSATHTEQPSAEEPDTACHTTKDKQCSKGMLKPNPGRANPI
jgi:hypothetical protein